MGWTAYSLGRDARRIGPVDSGVNPPDLSRRVCMRRLAYIRGSPADSSICLVPLRCSIPSRSALLASVIIWSTGQHLRFWTARFSLDEHARKFLTASAPTGRPGSAPALVQQGLQPILIRRQRPNPSRVVKNLFPHVQLRNCATHVYFLETCRDL